MYDNIHRIEWDKLVADLTGPGMDNAIDEELRKCAAWAKDRFMRDTPVDTGRLQNSYVDTRVRPRDYFIGSYLFYAAAVEFGHRTKGGGYVQGRQMVAKNIQPLINHVRQKLEALIQRRAKH